MTTQDHASSDEPVLPFSEVSAVLARVTPLQPTHKLEAALSNAFPARTWLVKKTAFRWHMPVSVVTDDGSLLAQDAETWVKEQVRISGSVSLLDRIKRKELLFARTGGDSTFYAVGYVSNAPLDFVQIHIRTQARVVFSFENILTWDLAAPDDWDGQVVESSPPVYACDPHNVIASTRWLEECKRVHRANRENQFGWFKRLMVTQIRQDGTRTRMPYLEANPLAENWVDEPCREERWCADWAASSAGAYPMARFWCWRTSDFIDRDGRHQMSFVPQATVWPWRIEAKHQTPSRLIEELDRFDKRVGHPFAWYFFLVHGNRLFGRVGEMIVEAVRAGALHLPPKDEAVLMRWAEAQYCF